MPRPALHGRFVPAAAKMASTPELSLRGRFAPVAISGRHLQGVQGIDKTHKPIASVAALSERLWQPQVLQQRFGGSRPPDLSLRGGRRPTWQSRGTCRIIGKPSAKSQLPSRDCTPRALPRASRSGRHVGLWPPRNDKSGAFAILTAVCTGCKCIAGPGCPLPYNAQTAALHNSGFSSKCI